MAKLSSYKNNPGINPLDKITYSGIIEDYEDLPTYETVTTTLDDLGEFFASNYFTADGVVYNLSGLTTDVSGLQGTTETIQSTLNSAFLVNGDGDVTGFTEALNSAVDTVIENADLTLNTVFSDLEDSQTTTSNGLNLISTDVANFFQGFSIDPNTGLPTGFGDTLLENIEGAAQAAIDLTPFATGEDLALTDEYVAKIRDAFTFDENGDVENFNTVLSTATDTKVRTLFTADGLAYGVDVDEVKTAVGTWDEDGNLLSLSNAFSGKISQVISTDTASLVQQVEQTRAGFSSFDPLTGEPTGLSSAMQTAVSTVVAGDGYAAGSDVEDLTVVVQGTDGQGGLVNSVAQVTSTVNTAATTASSAASKVEAINSVFEVLDENGDPLYLNQAGYFNEITTYVDANSAIATEVDTLKVTVDGPNGNDGIAAEVGTHSSAIADLEGYTEANYAIEADANGVVTGIYTKAANSGDPDTVISDITMKTNTFKVVDQLDNTKLYLDANGDLTVYGSGEFTGDITGASGTFGGVTINSNGISSNSFSIAGDDITLTSSTDVAYSNNGSLTFNDGGASPVLQGGLYASTYNNENVVQLKGVDKLLLYTQDPSVAGIRLDNNNTAAWQIYVNGNLYSYDGAYFDGILQVGDEIQAGNNTITGGAFNAGLSPALNAVVNVYQNSGSISDPVIRCAHGGTYNGSAKQIAFYNAAISEVGYIYSTNSTTNLQISSDYRLKENVVSITGAIDKIDQLNPVNFDWVRGDGNDNGFLAHELKEILPMAVHGEKDEVDDNGDPVYQSANYMALIPILTAALKEANDKIKSLETRIIALEA